MILDLHMVSDSSGSPLLSRLLNYYPLRFEAAVFIDIGYSAPPLALNVTDIEAINNKTFQALGYSIFGYWLFFDEPDAADITDAHVRFYVSSCRITLSYKFSRAL
jgi:soluble epoxide hydrolase/lipid-phosphate phosphatase